MAIFASNYIGKGKKGKRQNDMGTNRREEIEFTKMLDNVKGILLKVCHAFTGRGKAETEDLYQEIVADLWQGKHTFRGESDVKTWVYKVAVNRALMYRRQQQRNSDIVLVPIDGKLADRLADEPEDKQIKLLYELIERLTDEEKTIIFLYIDRHKTGQIAQAIGKSESAVRQIISRTKIKLRILYEKERENDR